MPSKETLVVLIRMILLMSILQSLLRQPLLQNHLQPFYAVMDKQTCQLHSTRITPVMRLSGTSDIFLLEKSLKVEINLPLTRFTPITFVYQTVGTHLLFMMSLVMEFATVLVMDLTLWIIMVTRSEK